MGLEISEINAISDNGSATGCSKQFYAVDDVGFTFEIVKRTMTKEEIEKELGYKINIKD